MRKIRVLRKFKIVKKESGSSTEVLFISMTKNGIFFFALFYCKWNAIIHRSFDCSVKCEWTVITVNNCFFKTWWWFHYKMVILADWVLYTFATATNSISDILWNWKSKPQTQIWMIKWYPIKLLRLGLFQDAVRRFLINSKCRQISRSNQSNPFQQQSMLLFMFFWIILNGFYKFFPTVKKCWLSIHVCLLGKIRLMEWLVRKKLIFISNKNLVPKIQ